MRWLGQRGLSGWDGFHQRREARSKQASIMLADGKAARRRPHRRTARRVFHQAGQRSSQARSVAGRHGDAAATIRQ